MGSEANRRKRELKDIPEKGRITVADTLRKAARAMPLKPALEEQDRLTVNCVVHHEHHGEAPLSVDARWNQLLETKAQPWVRRLEFEVKKVPLIPAECWIENPGMLLIENRAGRALQRNPTQEEKDEITASVLLVYLSEASVDPIVIRPGRFAFVEVLHPRNVFIAACVPGTKANVFIFSK